MNTPGFLQTLAVTAKSWSDETLLKSIDTAASSPEILAVLMAELEVR